MIAAMVDIPLALIKSAAVSGITFVWVNFTVKAFKMAWHIISTSPGEKEFWLMKKLVMCEECRKYFVDDGKEFEHGKFLCMVCADWKSDKNILNEKILVQLPIRKKKIFI